MDAPRLLIGFLSNVSLTFVLLFLYSILRSKVGLRWRRLEPVAMGAFFGLAAIVGMLSPLSISPGVFIDSKLVIMGLSGALGGPLSALVTALIAGSYRWLAGGIGAFPGVVTIVATGLLGCLFYRSAAGTTRGLQWGHFALLGAGTVAVGLSGILLLPSAVWAKAFEASWLAVAVFYPTGTLGIGLLFRYQLERDAAHARNLELNQKLEDLLGSKTTELRRTEQSLRLILDNLPEAVFIYDDSGCIVEVNGPMLTMFEIEHLDQVLGQSPLRFSSIDPQPGLALESLALPAAGASLTFEWKCCPLVTQKPFVTEVTLTRIEFHGEPHHMAVVRDITRRKQDEAELKRYQDKLEDLVEARSRELTRMTERLRMATEGAQMGIFDWDVRTDTLVWDDTMFRLYGVDPSAFLGTSLAWSQTLHPEDRAEAEDKLRRALAGIEVFDTEYRIVLNDASIRSIRAYGQVVRDSQGAAVRMVGINHDVSRLKSTERALVVERNTAQRYLDLVEVMLVALDDKGNITLLNRKGHEILGYAPGELKDQQWFRLCIPKDAYSATLQTYQELMAGETVQLEYFENEIITKTGERKLIAWHNSLVTDNQGQIMGTLSSGEDITAQRRAEQQVELFSKHLEDLVNMRTKELEVARDEANSANVAKSLFLANMSHEIRTPMNAVLGFAQLLGKDQSLSKDGHDKVATIIRSGEHLLAIINDILEMSRIESGRLELRPETLDLFEMLDDLAQLYSFKAKEKGLELKAVRSAEIPRHIVTDPVRLRQILINLLGNALKFTQQGTIELTASLETEGKIVILVADTGIGIPVDEQSRLFQPFERTQGGESTASGTGLGLAISRKFAQLLGGDLTIDKTPRSRGTCFRLEIRAEVAAPPPTEPRLAGPATQLTQELRGVQVLVVDDLRANRELLRGFLEPLGFQVIQASGGKEALKQVQEGTVRIVLMDLQMAGMDGAETTRHLRNSPRGSELTIIGITASAFEEQKRSFMAAGLDDFLAKPFREQDLLDVLARRAKVVFHRGPVETGAQSPGPEKPVGFSAMPAPWRAAFRQALSQGNVSQLRLLGKEAQSLNAVLSHWILDKVSEYNLNELKRIEVDHV